jgi:GPH family glycoside/pentoside/hexuronide:cation symporter
MNSSGSTSSQTAPEDRIPVSQKLAYAAGMLANNLQAAALPAIMVILNLGLGMDPRWVGVIGFAPRILDALTDPMMGYISDNTRSKWGRRRPYIFIGAILAGVVFAGMWQVPQGLSDMFYVYFFFAAFILFFLTYTVYATPFVAFGYEMTADYNERTRLHAFANTAGQFAWLAIPWFWAFIASEQFDGPADGASVLAMGIGITVILLGVIPAIFCRERVLPESSEAPKDKSGLAGNTKEFFAGLGTTMKRKPFVRLCLATFLIFGGFQLASTFDLYVIRYYVFGGEDGPAGQLYGTYGTVTTLCTIGVIALTAVLAKRMGKREAFRLTIGISIIGYGLKWIGYNQDMPYLLLMTSPLVAFGVGSLFTLMGSMISDVCDYDESESGERREGTFGAIYWWMVKVGIALAALGSGWLLSDSGFNVDLGADQSESALFYIRFFNVVIPVATSAIAIIVMWRYEISETRANEIRSELEARRGKISS